MKMRNATGLRRLHRQAGHTLLEWLVAAALGLVVLGGGLTLYRSQREAFARAADAARMREAGAAALTLVGQHIQMAGYAPVDAPTLRARVMPGLLGCESARPAVGAMDGEPACSPHPRDSSGDADAISSSRAFGSLSASALWSRPGGLSGRGSFDSDGIVVRYIDDGVATWRSASGEPTDCLGQGVTRHGAHAVIVNRFYAAKPPQREAPELYCGGNGRTITPQPLVEGVEGMRLRYWLRGAAEPVGARAISTTQWGDVVAVDLCVRVRGRGRGARVPKAFVDCDGKLAQSRDGYERLSLSRHLVLRNQAPAS